MKIFGIKKQLQFVIAVFLTSTLIFAQSCYATDTSIPSTANSTLLSAGGVATALVIGGGIPALLAALTGRSTTPNTANTATLTSITVTPNNSSVAVGNTKQFIAIGTYSNNATQDITSQVSWLSSVDITFSSTTPGLATVSSTAPVGELITITAMLSEITSAQATLSTVQGGPVILSTSNHNLLSYNSATATGTVTVRNNSNATQTISIANTILPIISPTNTCSNVAAWETCQFTINYSSTSSQTTVNFQVKDGNNVTDTIAIKTIKKAADAFYDPSIDGTNAYGLPFQPTTFVTANKNGIDFLYTAITDLTNYKYYGVFRSSDSGASWTPINEALSNLLITDLYAKEDKLCIATTVSGIFFSADAGENFTQSSGISNTASANVLSKGKNLYAGIWGSGLSYSTDQGATWSTITTGIPDIDTGKVIALHTTQNTSANDTLYVIMYGFPYNNIYQGIPTSNTTWSWTLITDLSTNNVTTSLYSTSNYLFAGTNNGIYRSNDNGITWNLMASSPIYVDNFCIIGGYLYARTSKVVYKSNDNGTTWVAFSSGLTGAGISTLNLINNQLYLGTDLGTYTMLATSSGWDLISPMLTMQILMSLSNNNYSNNLYTAVGTGTGYGSGVFVSSDGGANWTIANNGLTNLSINILYSDSSYLYAGTNGGGVFKSSDGGNNWTAMGLSGKNVMSLCSKGSILYAGTNYDGVWKSDNGGDWEEMVGLAGKNVLSLSLNNYDVLYAGVGDADGVHKWTNNSGWSSNLLTTSVSTRALYFDSSTLTLYAGTQRGIYSSTDGANFTLNVPLPTISDSIQTFHINTSTNMLYAGLIPDGSTNPILSRSGSTWAEVGSIGYCKVYSLSSIGTPTLYVASNLKGIRKNGP